MPTIHVAFTEDEIALIRREAGPGRGSLEAFVHDAALAASFRRPSVTRAAGQVSEWSAELNSRLANNDTNADLTGAESARPRRRPSSYDRRVQIAAAKARVGLDKRLRVTTPLWIIQLANEEPE